MPATRDKDAPRSPREDRFAWAGRWVARPARPRGGAESRLIRTGRQHDAYRLLRTGAPIIFLEQTSQPLGLDTHRGTALRVEVGVPPKGGRRDRKALEPISPAVQRFFDDEFEEIRGIRVFPKLGVA